MTENEALSALHFLLGYEKAVDKGEIEGNSFLNSQEKEALQFILEEIQQYRAMEEKLNGISVEQVVNGFINTVEDRTEEPYERGRILTNAEADMWNEYRAIGTIEEFNALKDAEEQGRLLPYKIGDKFYEPIEWKNCAEECKISSFTIKADGGLKIRLSGTYGVFEITTEEIGKTVFFTKEEAEQALAKRKGK